MAFQSWLTRRARDGGIFLSPSVPVTAGQQLNLNLSRLNMDDPATGATGTVEYSLDQIAWESIASFTYVGGQPTGRPGGSGPGLSLTVQNSGFLRGRLELWGEGVNCGLDGELA